MNRAVLLIIFNREQTTAQVFGAIRAARPPRLYVAADGARAERGEEEEIKCRATRAAVLDNIDWPCEVFTRLSDHNQGCGPAVSSAITWFFDHEPDGIILEDDCLPHPDFFSYCEELLDRYADDHRVAFIGGNNHDFFDKPTGDPSYYFSAYNHVWGWASWRRTWELFDYHHSGLKFSQYCSSMRRFGLSFVERYYWSYLFLRLRTVGFNAWDYPLSMTLQMRGLLSIIPQSSVIANIGFAADATHTVRPTDRRYCDRPLLPIMPLTHPDTVERNALYDRRYIVNEIKSRPLMPLRYLYYAARYFFSIKVQ